MRYLEEVILPSRGQAEAALEAALRRRTCYNNHYPFGILEDWEEAHLPLEPLTILCGGNGSGKTTLLNLVGEKLGLERRSAYNRPHLFDAYRELLRCRSSGKSWRQGQVLTSDDVFDDLLDQRSLDQGLDLDRSALLQEYKALRQKDFQFRSLEDFEELKKVVLAKRRRGSGSAYVRDQLGRERVGQSNGETALGFFTHRIQDDGLYLLDEPENSMSAPFQQELGRFLADSVRFFGCQVILATHSPFLLSLPGALVYDLDRRPIRAVPWTRLSAVRAYYEFFKAHGAELEAEQELVEKDG